MNVFQPPDSPRFPYEDQHWELEAKNKQDFIEHFMSTKYDNIHIKKGVYHDFEDLLIKVQNRIHNLSNVNTVGDIAITNRYNNIMSLMRSPYTKRFKTAEDREDPETVLLRPGDTWANIAFKAHLSFQSIDKNIIEFYDDLGDFLFRTCFPNHIRDLHLKIEKTEAYVQHILYFRHPQASTNLSGG